MKILFTERPIEEVDREGLEILRKLGSVVVALDTTEQTLRREVREADVLVVRLAKVTKKVIEDGCKLKVIGRTGAGVDNIDVDAATNLGIRVLNVPALNADSVAEHVFGLILVLSRCIMRFDSEIRKGDWKARDELISLNSELFGKTLGVVGFGAIGSRVAKIGAAFGMKVLVHDPYVSPEMFQKAEATKVEMNRLIADSDVITIHAARTKDTYHLISKNAFSLMKKRAILINCSRGDIVNEKALVDALERNLIAGAGLDVFELEPLSVRSTLCKMGNVILTPHVAGFTREARAKTMVTLARDIAKVLSGERPINLVNEDGLRTRGFNPKPLALHGNETCPPQDLQESRELRSA